MTVPITLDDMMTGIVWGCASRHIESFPVFTESFYLAVMAAFETMEAYASTNPDVDLRFWLCLDPLYQDNSQVGESVNALVQRRMLDLDGSGKIARICDSPAVAASGLKTLPGNGLAYKACTDAFLSSLR